MATHSPQQPLAHTAAQNIGRRIVSGDWKPGSVLPNLDRLAARGVRFTNAYTTCPICVPARTSLATGRYVFQTRSWDNAHPYHGEIASWGHRLMERGHRVTSVGKLHYRDNRDPNGFDEEILPLHVLDGVGDLLGLIRMPPAPRGNMPGGAGSSGGLRSIYAGRL